MNLGDLSVSAEGQKWFIGCLLGPMQCFTATATLYINITLIDIPPFFLPSFLSRDRGTATSFRMQIEPMKYGAHIARIQRCLDRLQLQLGLNIHQTNEPTLSLPSSFPPYFSLLRQQAPFGWCRAMHQRSGKMQRTKAKNGRPNIW